MWVVARIVTNTQLTLRSQRNQVGLSFLLRAYLGLGRTKIAHGDRSQRKGISVERTFNPDDSVEGFYKRVSRARPAASF